MEQEVREKLSLTIDRKTKEALFKVDIEESWEIYEIPSLHENQTGNLVMKGKGRGIFPFDGFDNNRRKYFKLKTEQGNKVFAERRLPMSGGYNFRDLGGITNQEGEKIKWGKLFRTDELSKLTSNDLQYLSSIPIYTVIDFRAEDEIAAAPNIFPHSVKEDYHFGIFLGNIFEYTKTSSGIKKHPQDLMKEINKAFVNEQDCINQYKAFFKILQKNKDRPLLYHCSAGKDRTGFATALILSALGVDEQSIMNDYLYSNICLGGKYDDIIAQKEEYRDYFIVREEYLQTAFDEIKKNHSSTETYLKKVLEVDISLLRDKYLEK